MNKESWLPVSLTKHANLIDDFRMQNVFIVRNNREINASSVIMNCYIWFRIRVVALENQTLCCLSFCPIFNQLYKLDFLRLSKACKQSYINCPDKANYTV